MPNKEFKTDALDKQLIARLEQTFGQGNVTCDTHGYVCNMNRFHGSDKDDLARAINDHLLGPAPDRAVVSTSGSGVIIHRDQLRMPELSKRLDTMPSFEVLEMRTGGGPKEDKPEPPSVKDVIRDMTGGKKPAGALKDLIDYSREERRTERIRKKRAANPPPPPDMRAKLAALKEATGVEWQELTFGVVHILVTTERMPEEKGDEPGHALLKVIGKLDAGYSLNPLKNMGKEGVPYEGHFGFLSEWLHHGNMNLLRESADELRPLFSGGNKKGKARGED